MREDDHRPRKDGHGQLQAERAPRVAVAIAEQERDQERQDEQPGAEPSADYPFADLVAGEELWYEHQRQHYGDGHHYDEHDLAVRPWRFARGHRRGVVQDRPFHGVNDTISALL